MSDKEEFFERFYHAIIEMELKVLDDIWQWIEEKLGKEYRRGFLAWDDPHIDEVWQWIEEKLQTHSISADVQRQGLRFARKEAYNKAIDDVIKIVEEEREMDYPELRTVLHRLWQLKEK